MRSGVASMYKDYDDNEEDMILDKEYLEDEEDISTPDLIGGSMCTPWREDANVIDFDYYKTNEHVNQSLTQLTHVNPVNSR